LPRFAQDADGKFRDLFVRKSIDVAQVSNGLIPSRCEPVVDLLRTCSDLLFFGL
jgi:hypothetical protein